MKGKSSLVNAYVYNEWNFTQKYVFDKVMDQNTLETIWLWLWRSGIDSFSPSLSGAWSSQDANWAVCFLKLHNNSIFKKGSMSYEIQSILWQPFHHPAGLRKRFEVCNRASLSRSFWHSFVLGIEWCSFFPSLFSKRGERVPSCVSRSNRVRELLETVELHCALGLLPCLQPSLSGTPGKVEHSP